MADHAEIAVVIISYNTRELLLECLASLIESGKGVEMEIVVVDNASVDGSPEAVAERFPKVIIINNESNLGFGAACNQAIRATTAPLILLLNSDARLNSQALEALLHCMNMNKFCGAAGCRLENAAGREAVNTRNFLSPLNQALEYAGVSKWTDWRYLARTRRPKLDENLIDCSIDWIEGSCLLLRRTALEEAGFFDEAFFMYSEDEDLCMRLRKAGREICFTAAGTALHHGGASTEQNRTGMLRHFYLSQILFLLKHRGKWSALTFKFVTFAVLAMKWMFFLAAARRERSEQMREQMTALRGAIGNGRWPHRNDGRP